jgi:hypothetical protein
MADTTGRYESFVLRVWRRGSRLVHGQVTHIATRRSVYFRDMRRLYAFMLGVGDRAERVGGDSSRMEPDEPSPRPERNGANDTHPGPADEARER